MGNVILITIIRLGRRKTEGRRGKRSTKGKGGGDMGKRDKEEAKRD